jgi:hypothetical protein
MIGKASPPTMAVTISQYQAVATVMCAGPESRTTLLSINDSGLVGAEILHASHRPRSRHLGALGCIRRSG